MSVWQGSLHSADLIICQPSRLAILELRAARGWSQAQTADHMLVTPATIASWMSRLDEEGPAGLVQMHEPVNRFPEFVSHVVCKLKILCPTMGEVRIAQFLVRAGLHLGSTTVARMLAAPTRPRPAEHDIQNRTVRSTRSNQIWNVALTTIPTACGFWVPWHPWALPQRWPFCWWVGVIVAEVAVASVITDSVIGGLGRTLDLQSGRSPAGIDEGPTGTAER